MSKLLDTFPNGKSISPHVLRALNRCLDMSYDKWVLDAKKGEVTRLLNFSKVRVEDRLAEMGLDRSDIDTQSSVEYERKVLEKIITHRASSDAEAPKIVQIADINIEIPGNAVIDENGNSFRPTQSQRETVYEKAYYQIPNRTIAGLIINPETLKPITQRTLEKAFNHEICKARSDYQEMLMKYALAEVASGSKSAASVLNRLIMSSPINKEPSDKSPPGKNKSDEGDEEARVVIDEQDYSMISEAYKRISGGDNESTSE